MTFSTRCAALRTRSTSGQESPKLHTPDWVVTTNTFVPLNRFATTGSAKGSSLSGYIYARFPAENVNTLTELNGRVVTYGYDNIYRLTTDSSVGCIHSGFGLGPVVFLGVLLPPLVRRVDTGLRYAESASPGVALLDTLRFNVFLDPIPQVGGNFAPRHHAEAVRHACGSSKPSSQNQEAA